MIRKIINKFSRSLSERLVAPRRAHAAPMRVWFEPAVDDPRQRELSRNAAVAGETVDLSRTGIAFLTPAIRIQEKYFVGHERTLNIEIDLPSGRVEMKVMGCRYEKVGIHLSVDRYLIGARILSMSDGDREAYENFVRYGSRRKSPQARAVKANTD
ncbi:MAG: hypothetical protein UZ17_ACD001002653 [Acidobacteria bacterium OLB17]|nr:MAG: hypothetical protein UZ17_ACD001002653 [Acidobacteria bacterium OLB17]MCZ2390876.1 PilZ domain-containing protein [Acidobacteriota bacterium]